MDTAKGKKEVIVNITPNASGRGLREELDEEARRIGLTLRALVSGIYAYAVGHKEQFRDPLQNPRGVKGDHIGATVSHETGSELTKWAKEKKVPRGIHCKYLLEKALESKLHMKIFTGR